MEIFLRSDEAGMAQKLLNVPDLHAVIQAMRSATVAQVVGMDSGNAGAFSCCDYHPIVALSPYGLRVWLSLRQFVSEVGVQG